MNHARRRAKAIFGIFLFVTLVLIIAVFGVAGAVTMVEQLSMVIPTFMVIFIAVVFGRAINKWNAPLVPATIIAVTLNIAFIVVGYFVPIDITTIWSHLDPADRPSRCRTNTSPWRCAWCRRSFWA